MQLQYLGHACFKVKLGDYEILLDPYEKGSVPGLRDLDEEVDLCLCSHGHGDHHGLDCVKIREGGENCPIRVEKLETWHDDRQGELRGSNIIHILHGEGMKVVHMGDIGCMPEKWQLEILEGADAVMIPVGGYYTAEPEVIAGIIQAIAPKVTIPMHYRSAKSGFPVIKTCEEYLSFCDNVMRYETDTLVLDEKTRPQTAVLLQRQWEA